MPGIGSYARNANPYASDADKLRYRIKQLNNALDLALISQGVYTKGGDPDRIKSRGWEMQTVVSDENTGFRAGLFFNAKLDQYVIAFAGTEGLFDPDAKADLTQGVGWITAQFEEANSAVNDFIAANQISINKLTLTGHSLGGGLASSASIIHNLPAITFNAAGVHRNTVGRFGKALNGADQLIDAYNTHGDPLSLFQNTNWSNVLSMIAPDTVGHRTGISAPSWNPKEWHSINQVILGLEQELRRAESDLDAITNPPPPRESVWPKAYSAGSRGLDEFLRKMQGGWWP